MSLRLPPKTSPIRELFDVAQLADIASPANRSRLPSFPQARQAAREFIEKERGVKSINSICLKACGDLELVTFTRTSHKTVFNFGRL